MKKLDWKKLKGERVRRAQGCRGLDRRIRRYS